MPALAQASFPGYGTATSHYTLPQSEISIKADLGSAKPSSFVVRKQGPVHVHVVHPLEEYSLYVNEPQSTRFPWV